MFDDFDDWCLKVILFTMTIALVGLVVWFGYGVATGFEGLSSRKCTVTITFNQVDGKNVLEKVESCSYGDK